MVIPSIRIPTMKVKMKIKNLIQKIRYFFSLHCPECKGRLVDVYLDRIGRTWFTVYRCTECGKEWI